MDMKCKQKCDMRLGPRNLIVVLKDVTFEPLQSSLRFARDCISVSNYSSY